MLSRRNTVRLRFGPASSQWSKRLTVAKSSSRIFEALAGGLQSTRRDAHQPARRCARTSMSVCETACSGSATLALAGFALCCDAPSHPSSPVMCCSQDFSRFHVWSLSDAALRVPTENCSQSPGHVKHLGCRCSSRRFRWSDGRIMAAESAQFASTRRQSASWHRERVSKDCPPHVACV